MAEQLDISFNEESLRRLGIWVNSTYEDYEKTRKGVEDQWLRNYRQYHGIYDPEIKIADGFSRAYPRITRTKVVGLLARLMEMVFGSGSRSWAISPSPVPNIPQDALQVILDELAQNLPEGELTTEDIETAVVEWTKKRATRMQRTIDDQLAEMMFESATKRVLKSGLLYGLGVMRGPMVLQYDRRYWEIGEGGVYQAVTAPALKPLLEPVRVWDFHADFGALSLEESDGMFELHTMNRHEMTMLKDRPDFNSKQLDEYLTQNPKGNYKQPQYEQQIRAHRNDKTRGNDQVSASNLYQMREYVGAIDGHRLKEMGVDVPKQDLSKDLMVNVWTIDNRVLKATRMPIERPTDFYHLFIFDDDSDGAAIGSGLPEVIRDSQMSVCASARMLLDNASVSAGPMGEANVNLLAPNEDLTIRPFKMFKRESSLGDDKSPAIRTLSFPSHTGELLSIMATFREIADEESMLPKFALGTESNPGEAFRTSGGTSQLFGAAAMTIKDVARQIDRYHTSLITAMVKWNGDFNDDQTIIGDFNVVAKGVTALVAKEIRGSLLDQMVATMTPEERDHLKERRMLEERLRAREVDPVEFLEDEDVVAQNRQARQEQAQQSQQVSDSVEKARALKLRTSAITEMMDATGKKELTGAQVEKVLAEVEALLSEVGIKDVQARTGFAQSIGQLLQSQNQGSLIEQPALEQPIE